MRALRSSASPVHPPGRIFRLPFRRRIWISIRAGRFGVRRRGPGSAGADTVSPGRGTGCRPALRIHAGISSFISIPRRRTRGHPGILPAPLAGRLADGRKAANAPEQASRGQGNDRDEHDEAHELAASFPLVRIRNLPLTVIGYIHRRSGYFRSGGRSEDPLPFRYGKQPRAVGPGACRCGGRQRLPHHDHRVILPFRISSSPAVAICRKRNSRSSGCRSGEAPSQASRETSQLSPRSRYRGTSSAGRFR